ncbi:MAG: hypothetical protein AAGG68_22000 [Bacteroidota bacterium]
MRLIIFLLFTATVLLFTSCNDTSDIQGQDIQNIDVESVKEGTNENYQSLITDEMFDELITEAYETFENNSFDSFVSSELEGLLEKSTLTTQEEIRMEELIDETVSNILDESQDLETTFNSVINLNLSYEELRDKLLEAEVDIESRGCWICNEKACITSAGVTAHGVSNSNPVTFLGGLIGIAIHCE